MNRPTFSVVVPCYNAGRFLAHTLAALRAQTLGDWEAIIVDDGSADRSADIAWALSEVDERIRVVYQTNQGVSKARNRGASLASADLIAFLDADDLWQPTFLEDMFAFMQTHPDVSIGFARARFVSEDGAPTGAVSNAKLNGLTVTDLLAGNPTTTCSNLVVRRDDFLQSGGFRPNLNHAEDQLWLLDMHLAGKKLCGLNKILLDYRTNTSGLSSDVEAMRLGWEEMVGSVCARHADKVQQFLAPARAMNLLYLARRAVRTGSGMAVALSYFRKAIESHWPTVSSVLTRMVLARV